MVILRDTIRVSGIPAETLLPDKKLDSILDEVRKAGDTILQMAQRSTSYYAPSAAVAALAMASLYRPAPAKSAFQQHLEQVESAGR